MKHPSSTQAEYEDTMDVEGHGLINIVFWSFEALRKTEMAKVLHGPGLSLNLFYLRAAMDLGHGYQGKIEDVTLYSKEKGDILFLPRGHDNYLEASRLSPAGEHAYAVVVSSIDQVGSFVGVNELYTAYGHANDGLLQDITARMGVTHKGKLEPYSICSQVKALGKAILSSTTTR